MTNTQIAEMIILREQGKSFREIGEKYGVSKQTVKQTLDKFEILNGRCRKGNATIENIVYQGIYDFFVDNPTLTVPKFCRLVLGYANHNSVENIRNFLKGMNIKLDIKTINNLIELTEKSYEELFKPREVNNNGNK